ncbi:alpha/beta hydrolase [Streptomyces sp. S9]|nr:alpha/beta hydrolase [Streptomyces sp. S9]
MSVRPGPRPRPAPALRVVDLDEAGQLLVPTARSPRPVPARAWRSYFAEVLRPPKGVTDIVVYVHGWLTSQKSALSAATELLRLTVEQHEKHPELYGALGTAFSPWGVVVRWPSRSAATWAGYRRIRDRAHHMGTKGQAARVVGQLLGYLDEERGDPRAAGRLSTRDGQYLHLVGHSFGCRLLCEAVQWAAENPRETTLGWSMPSRPCRPFGVDSMLLLQMAAPRNAFSETFTSLGDAPLRGPVVATYSQHDRATGFWHLRAEKRAGIGHAGIGTAPAPLSGVRMLSVDEAYPLAALDHRFVNVDASEVFVGGGLSPGGAHSDHLRGETAHLLLSLASHSR